MVGSTNGTEAAVTVHWEHTLNEFDDPMLWFGSWLTGDDGSEGDWFYSGRGGETGRYAMPPDARGVRIRFWPSEGFQAEYVDIESDGPIEIRTTELDTSRRQRFSRLSLFEDEDRGRN